MHCQRNIPEPSKQNLEFELIGSESSPIVNIPMFIKNWKATIASVEINEKKAIQGIDYMLGYLPTIEGEDLVIWIDIKSTSVVKVKIR